MTTVKGGATDFHKSAQKSKFATDPTKVQWVQDRRGRMVR
jgi:hypothetical protein